VKAMTDTRPTSQPHVPLRRIEYAINLAALAKWAGLNLHAEPRDDGATHYRFQYLGSTCHSGGKPIRAVIHAIIRPGARGHVFERGWIDCEPASGARLMCATANHGPEFLADMPHPPSFEGLTLDEILTSGFAVNQAGCFCSPPMRNHKWRQMLSTIHFVLLRRFKEQEEKDKAGEG
jgi:hypothetical protein